MSEMKGYTQRASGIGSDDGMDPVLQAALADFRESVHSWSEAAYSSPRAVPALQRRTVWKRSLGWALGLAVAAGVAGAGIHERQHQKELARLEAERQAQQRQQLAAQQAKQADDLLAKIDSDVSREVPSAMEPLAQLMDDNSNQ